MCRMNHFTNIERWLRDAPPKVLRFPIFTQDMPARLIAEAAAKFKRTAHIDGDTGLVRLERREACVIPFTFPKVGDAP